MRFPRYLVATTLGLMPIGTSHGAGLDDFGGIENSTVRTEIHRGAMVFDDCASKVVADNLALADCIYTAHTANVRGGTATLAFALGLFFDAWLQAANNPDVKKRHSPAEVGRDFFFYEEQHRTALGLTLDEVCAAAQLSCDKVEPVWKEWEARMEKSRH
jgi:hypothetical protein